MKILETVACIIMYFAAGEYYKLFNFLMFHHCSLMYIIGDDI
jgi:hypothetical protein